MISPDSFDAAYADPANRAIMARACQPYRYQFTADEIDQEQRIALWHALRQFDPEFGQKFTSSLYRHVIWRMQYASRERRTRRHTLISQSRSLFRLADIVAQQPSRPDYADLYECIDQLEPEIQSVVRAYYLEGWSFLRIARDRGISRYLAKKQVLAGLSRLREIYLESSDGLPQSPP